MVGTRLRRRIARWLTIAGTVVGVASQATVAIAAIGEARLGPPTTHVEATGTGNHHVHDNVTCAICRAQLGHGLAGRSPCALTSTAADAAECVAIAERPIRADVRTPDNPRAPPLG